MAQSFKEVAHLRGDDKAYQENWERIFGKDKKAQDEKEQEEAEELPSEQIEALSSKVE